MNIIRDILNSDNKYLKKLSEKMVKEVAEVKAAEVLDLVVGKKEVIGLGCLYAKNVVIRNALFYKCTFTNNIFQGDTYIKGSNNQFTNSMMIQRKDD